MYMDTTLCRKKKITIHSHHGIHTTAGTNEAQMSKESDLALL